MGFQSAVRIGGGLNPAQALADQLRFEFQSAVRIGGGLNPLATQPRRASATCFNPPCGSVVG